MEITYLRGDQTKIKPFQAVTRFGGCARLTRLLSTTWAMFLTMVFPVTMRTLVRAPLCLEDEKYFVGLFYKRTLKT